MDQDELAKKIAQAADEGWTTLDLSEEEIDYLPADIGDLTDLTSLNLYGNQLTVYTQELKILVAKGAILLGNPIKG